MLFILIYFEMTGRFSGTTRIVTLHRRRSRLKCYMVSCQPRAHFIIVNVLNCVMFTWLSLGTRFPRNSFQGVFQGKSGLFIEEPVHNFEGWSKADTIALGKLLVRQSDRKMLGAPTCPYSALLSSNFYLLFFCCEVTNIKTGR